MRAVRLSNNEKSISLISLVLHVCVYRYVLSGFVCIFAIQIDLSLAVQVNNGKTKMLNELIY